MSDVAPAGLPKVDVVIVNWNSGHYLGDCVNSLREFASDELASVTIVDNGSSDGSLDIDDGGLAPEIVEAGKNLGFARACNVGAARGTSRYVLFLNPDTRLLDNALEKSMTFMERNVAVGVCGVQMIGETGEVVRHCSHFPPWRYYVGKSFGLDGVLSPLFPAQYMVEFDHRSSRQVDHVTGAFFLVRREVFNLLAGFDERFFVYQEDLDFCLRAKRAGWTTWYFADTRIYHKGGGSSQNVKAARLFYAIESRIIYAVLHYSRMEAIAVITTALFVEPFSRLVQAALRRSLRDALNTLKGYVMILRNLRNVWRKQFEEKAPIAHPQD